MDKDNNVQFLKEKDKSIPNYKNVKGREGKWK